MLVGLILVQRLTCEKKNWYEWTAITNSTILLENMGQIAVINDHWTVLSVFNPSDRYDTDKFLRTCINMVETACYVHMGKATTLLNNYTNNTEDNQLKFEANCEVSIRTIKSLARRMLNLGNKLESLTRSYRSKRSIEPMGALLKWAFGTLDSTDAHKYGEMFGKIERNQNVTFHMIHEQVTLMSSTMQSLLKPLQNLENEQGELQLALRKISNDVDELSNTTRREAAITNMKVAINSFLEAITLKLEEIAVIRLEEISTMDALIDGIFHHNLIDIAILKESYLSMLRGNKEYMMLPEPPYSSMVVDTFTLGSKIYIKITVPLPSSTIYNLKKVYPVLQHRPDGWTLVPVLDIQWIASDIRQRKFISWTDNTFKCTMIQWKNEKKLKICESNGVSTSGFDLGCFSDNLNIPKNDTMPCQFKWITSPKISITELSTANRWLLSTKSKEKVWATCRSRTEEELTVIYGTGILEITEPCNLYIDGIHITYKKRIETQIPSVSVIETPQIVPQPPQWDDTLVERAVATKMKDIKLTTHETVGAILSRAIDDTERLNKEWHKEENIRENQKEIVKMEIHGWTIGGLMMTTTIILAILSIIIWYLKRQNSTLHMAADGLGRLGQAAMNLPGIEMATR